MSKQKRKNQLATLMAIVTDSKNSVFQISSTLRDANKCFNIIWDSGASVCITNCKDDFVDFKPSTLSNVKGIAGKSVKVEGQGTVRWTVHDINGATRTFNLQAFYVPSSQVRLLSTTQLLRHFSDETISINQSHLSLSGSDSAASVVAPFDPASHLPVSIAYNSTSAFDSAANSLYNVMTTVDDNNHNLSPAEKELLRWHCKLGHLSFKKVQHLMRTGVLSNTEATRRLHTAACKIITAPKCTACLFAKQTARPTAGTSISIVKDRAGVLKQGNLLPGQEVSVDHFICSTKGRLFSGYNKGSDTSRFCGGCIFVDHASGFLHVEHQSSLSSHDTLQAKLNFDKICQDSGIMVQKFMSDNGTAFTSQQFSSHLEQFKQVSKFAGAGAHHHNAQAERSIRTIMSISRAMLLHAAIHWPDMASPTLWPMAVSHAVYIWNHVPNPTTGLSPADLFTKSRWPHHRFHDFHVWGCPAYVLDKTIAVGMKIPRWKPRSNRCVYLGKSPRHASNVPLVLNPSTGAITGQFHVVMDDWFATVASDCNALPDFNSDDWNKLFGDSSFQYLQDDLDTPTDVPTASDTADHNSATATADRIANSMDALTPSKGLPVEEPASEPSPLQRTPPVQSPLQRTPTATPFTQRTSSPSNTNFRRESSSFSNSPLDSPIPPSTPSPDPTHTPSTITISSPSASPSASSRPSRNRKPVERLTYDGSKQSFTGKSYLVNIASVASAGATNVCAYFQHLHDIIICKAKITDDPDTLSYDQAMSDADCDHWIDSAVKEIESLEEHGTWNEIPIEQATCRIIPGTWVFTRKRNPDGTFKKFKARYCIRGDLEESDAETYSPVVAYSTVRLFLVIALALQWDTITIDFSNAFVQAVLNEDAFIHLPRGFVSSLPGKTCLKLNKSIYGKRDSPRLWYLCISEPLLELGFNQSKHDQCLFIRHDCILILFVDDVGICFKSKEVLEELLSQITQRGFHFTRQESFNEYLGIQYTESNGTIKMSQPGLIKKIIAAAGMKDCNPCDNPTLQQALGSNPDGAPMTDSWSYRSIIGMLLYLSGNTRPDIAFAVSQAARFSHSPKQSHATAVKRIIRYLKATATEGTLFRRPSSIQLEMYVDADFAGLWGVEAPNDPTSVKSRSGHIISISGCYLIAKSCLQTSIAQSTGESEYIALSHSLRALIPIRSTLLEILKTIDLPDHLKATLHSKVISDFNTLVHEDNSSALMLATEQRVTPRTKHYAVKMHWFWSIINERNNIDIVKVDTKLQQADYLTKGLPTPEYQARRKMSQGW